MKTIRQLFLTIGLIFGVSIPALAATPVSADETADLQITHVPEINLGTHVDDDSNQVKQEDFAVTDDNSATTADDTSFSVGSLLIDVNEVALEMDTPNVANPEKYTIDYTAELKGGTLSITGLQVTDPEGKEVSTGKLTFKGLTANDDSIILLDSVSIDVGSNKKAIIAKGIVKSGTPIAPSIPPTITNGAITQKAGTTPVPIADLVSASNASAKDNSGSFLPLTVDEDSYRAVNWDRAGTYEVTIKALDASGNQGFGIIIVTLTDRPVPTQTPTITSISDDTGTIGDFITNDTSLTVNGNLDVALGTDESIEISTDGGTIWTTTGVTQPESQGTTWSYTDSRTLENGQTYNYKVRVIDAAGNIGTHTASQAVTIDTTAPTQTPAITQVNGKAVTEGQAFPINDMTPTIGGTLTGTLATGEALQIKRDSETTWHDVTVNSGSWAYIETNTLTNGSTYTYEVRVIDAAGNVDTHTDN